MRTKILIPLVFLTTLILFGGCIDQSQPQDITSIVKAIPLVQKFLAEHPNAEITAALWSTEAINNNISTFHAECGEQIEVRPYWRAEVSEENLKLVVWLNPQTQQPVCAKLKSVEGDGSVSQPEEKSECISSDPAKIVYVEHSASPTELNLILSNLTGGNIKISKIELSDDFGGLKAVSPAPNSVTYSGSNFNINLKSTSHALIPKNYQGEIQVSYTDYASLSRDLIVSCKGTIPNYPSMICTSNDSTRLLIETFKIMPTKQEIKLRNLTGGDIVIEDIHGDELIFLTEGAVFPSGKISSGDLIDLLPNCSACTEGAEILGKITINYMDYASINRFATILCEGTIPTS